MSKDGETQKTTVGCLVLIVIVGLFAWACSAVGGSDHGKSNEGTAAIMCQGFVKDRLKAPGSAKFAGVFDTNATTVSTKKPWRFEVRAYVDSQNSFGAMIRNDYVCKIATEDGDNWTLEDLQLTEH